MPRAIFLWQALHKKLAAKEGQENYKEILECIIRDDSGRRPGGAGWIVETNRGSIGQSTEKGRSGGPVFLLRERARAGKLGLGAYRLPSLPLCLLRANERGWRAWGLKRMFRW